MLKAKIVLLFIIFMGSSTLAHSQGLWGTCVGVWAKLSSYMGWDGAGGKIRTLEQTDQYLRDTFALKPDIVQITLQNKLEDSRFGEFSYGERLYRYEALPNYVKGVPDGHMLFYGRAASSLNDAIGQSKAFFARGRIRSQDAHKDIKQHIASTKDAPSSFIQTTHSYEIAQFFAQGHKTESPKGHGVVFIINPKGAELLDIDQFLRYSKHVSRFIQREVVLFRTLRAERVVGAVILEKNEGVWRPVQYLRNSLAEL